jgi:hypothetical protein
MPKGTDLSVHSAEDLARFARSLNNRPRKTLKYMKLPFWQGIVKVLHAIRSPTRRALAK